MQDMEYRKCELCEEEYQTAEESDDEYCEECDYQVALDRAADRRYRRAEAGYPDA